MLFLRQIGKLLQKFTLSPILPVSYLGYTLPNPRTTSPCPLLLGEGKGINLLLGKGSN